MDIDKNIEKDLVGKLKFDDVVDENNYANAE